MQKNKKRIYLDHAASTPLRKEVILVMKKANKIFGNPSAIYKEGRIAKSVLEKARFQTADVLNCLAEEIIFTNGGTESDNLAILGAARAYKNKFEKPRIIISKIEHPAVLGPAEQLANEGFDVRAINIDKKGVINLEELRETINNRTILISIMYANNEIGVIQPIKKIAEIIKTAKVDDKLPLFHTDACQAAGYLDLNVKNLAVDLMTLNGSKIYGPKGSGALFIKKGIKIEPILFGGGQEKTLRSGTENLVNWLGFSRALELADKEKSEQSIKTEKLKDYLIKRTIAEIPGVFLNGCTKERLPNNVNFTILGVEGEALTLVLDQAGFAVSTGSACHSKSLEPSYVLSALGLPREIIHGSLRISLGRNTKKSELSLFIKELKKAVEKLREISAVDWKELRQFVR